MFCTSELKQIITVMYLVLTIKHVIIQNPVIPETKTVTIVNSEHTQIMTVVTCYKICNLVFQFFNHSFI